MTESQYTRRRREKFREPQLMSCFVCARRRRLCVCVNLLLCSSRICESTRIRVCRLQHPNSERHSASSRTISRCVHRPPSLFPSTNAAQRGESYGKTHTCARESNRRPTCDFMDARVSLAAPSLSPQSSLRRKTLVAQLSGAS